MRTILYGGAALLLCLGLAATSFAGSGSSMGEKSDPSMGGSERGLSGTGTEKDVVKGELMRVEDDFYVVKDRTGREVRLQIDETTTLDPSIAEGDQVKARVSSDGRTIAILKSTEGGMGSSGQSGERGSSSERMPQGGTFR